VIIDTKRTGPHSNGEDLPDHSELAANSGTRSVRAHRPEFIRAGAFRERVRGNLVSTRRGGCACQRLVARDSILFFRRARR
jgi:hypothetical protein